MNKPTRVALYVIVAMLSGFGLWQIGSTAVSYSRALNVVVTSGVTRDDLIFLRQAKFQGDQQRATAAAKPPVTKVEP